MGPTEDGDIASAHPHSPTTATAFSLNSDPSLIYRRTMLTDRCPVWFMIARSEAPASRRWLPDRLRRLCPAKWVASRPTAPTYLFTMSPTAAAESRDRRHFAVPIDGPEQWSVSDAALLKPILKRTDRARRRVGTVRNPDLPAFGFLIGLRSPDRHHQPVSGECYDRHHGPAPPTPSAGSPGRTRSRAAPDHARQAGPSGNRASMRFRSSTRTGVLAACAVPIVRRMPAMTRRTLADPGGRLHAGDLVRLGNC